MAWIVLKLPKRKWAKAQQLLEKIYFSDKFYWKENNGKVYQLIPFSNIEQIVSFAMKDRKEAAQNSSSPPPPPGYKEVSRYLNISFKGQRSGRKTYRKLHTKKKQKVQRKRKEEEEKIGSNNKQKKSSKTSEKLSASLPPVATRERSQRKAATSKGRDKYLRKKFS